MPRNLVVCLDGTWNTEEDGTNVYLTYLATKDAAGADEQLSYYDPGVGTEPGQKYTGGALGRGLSENIRQAYAWLMKNYQPGDKIFITGFSRGAYTARSLAGMIGWCGLPKRTGNDELDAQQVKEAYRLYRYEQRSNAEKCVAFKAKGHAAPIEFLGVYDTVGALGLPIKTSIEDELWGFHDTNLGDNVKHAFHAVAIHEKRPPYLPTMWHCPAKNRGVDTFEQCWFAGAHSDVGGGYDRVPIRTADGVQRALSHQDHSLKWMLEKAMKCGLKVSEGHVPEIVPAHYKLPIHDSLGGCMRRVFGGSKRTFTEGPETNERLHPSVALMERCRPEDNLVNADGAKIESQPGDPMPPVYHKEKSGWFNFSFS